MSGYIGDGVPDSGRYNYDPKTGQVLTGPSDSSMLCIFYKRPIHNEVLSAQHGRPMYVDMDYVRIQQPGETSQVVDRPTKEDDKRRWPAQWNAYAAGKDQVAEGTPLGLLFPRHPAAIANLQALGIMTVEHLANASATAIAAIGMNGQDYVNYAQKYINGASRGAQFHQMQHELEQEKRRADRLQHQVSELVTQVQQLNGMLMANAGVGHTPMPGVPRQPAPMPAQTMPGGSMPRAPTFGGSMLDENFDAQTAQINATHAMGPNLGQVEAPTPKKGGWPKGKKRKPDPSAGEAA